MTLDNTVEVVCQFRCVRDKTIAIWDGIKIDARGAEEWTWLPRSKVSWVHKTHERVGASTVVMPEWMARDRGLPWRQKRTLAEWEKMNKPRFDWE